MTQLEETTELKLDFEKLQSVADTRAKVVPVVLQNGETKDVLYLGYANEEALAKTLEEKRAVLFSTSRNELWRKGETSGDVLELIDVRVNCEQNSLLYVVKPVGSGVCHSKNRHGQARKTCYYRKISSDGLEFFYEEG